MFGEIKMFNNCFGRPASTVLPVVTVPVQPSGTAVQYCRRDKSSNALDTAQHYETACGRL